MEFDGDPHNSHSISDTTLSGGIFMCNRETMRECYYLKLFGCPSSQANFVKKIKRGMTLFLFEHEKRKLYGVFRASTDGAMNIIPNAFKSSGKQFPAQVRVRLVKDCYPLAERDFRDVIKENYYTSQKFEFGLSKTQVHKLLELFTLREKRHVRLPKSITTNTRAKKVRNRSGLSKKRVSEKGRYVRTDRAETAHGNDNDVVCVNRKRRHLSPIANQTRILADSRKLVLERDDLLVQGSDGSSFRLPHSEEPRLEDLYCSNSHRETHKQCVIPPHTESYLSKDSTFNSEQPTSFAITDHKTPGPDHALYSNFSKDSLSAQPRSQVISLPTRYHSPDPVTSLRDYIPLDSEVEMEKSEYYEEKSGEYSSFEGGDRRVPIPDLSVNTMAISNKENFETENITSLCFSSDKRYSPVAADPDYVSGVLRYWKYDPATGTIPLSSDDKSDSQLVGYLKESQSIGHVEYPSDSCEDYITRVNFRSDTHTARTSVFSRLTKVRDTVEQNRDCIVDAVIEDRNLSRRRMQRWVRSSRWNDDRDNYDIITEMEMGEDADLVKANLSETEGGPTLLVNFKRRSEIQKRHGDIQMEGYKIAVEGENSFVTSGKRRKLIRPSFESEELDTDKVISEEGSEENHNELSQNFVPKDDNNGKLIESPNQETSKGLGGVSGELDTNDRSFNVTELDLKAQGSTESHVEIAEKVSSTAEKELGEGSFRIKTTDILLVDNGGCQDKSYSKEKDLTTSESEPKKRIRRVKIIKRVKKKISNPQSN